MKTIVAVLAMALPALAQDSAREEIENRLKNVRVSLDFKNAPLDSVVDYLREISSINMIVDPRVRDKNIMVSMKVSEISLRSIFGLMLKPHDCGVMVKDGVLQILPKEVIRDRTLKMEIYDCRDILYPIQDFPGVDIALDTGAGIIIQEAAKDAGGEMPIVELIKAHTGGKSWDEDSKTSCAMQNGLLVVKQTPEVHAQVARLLNLLRRHK
jgi:type II secretory pathway component GspD/PulD (secretin)